jgi:hypothetical protein
MFQINYVYSARFETILNKDIITNISSNIHYMFNHSNSIFEIGKKYDDLVKSENGAISTFYINFNIKNISDINIFSLKELSYKDYVTIIINNKRIYSTINSDNMILNNKDQLKEKIYNEEYKFYNVNDQNIETWKWNNINTSINVKQYLTNGSNKIEIKLAYGKQGGFYSLWNLVQKSDNKITCTDLPHNRANCVSSGEKIVDGVRISMACWQYSYKKSCNYQSKNDCNQYAHCTLVSDRECLLHDYYGACINLKREMSCEKSTEDSWETEIVDFDKSNRNISSHLVCSNFPCIDGSCVNQDLAKNTDMMESIFKLTAVSKMKGGDVKTTIFRGASKFCNNTRILGYHDCCKIKGWGRYLGSLCSQEELDLTEQRKAGKCIYVGKRSSKILGGAITIMTRNA